MLDGVPFSASRGEASCENKTWRVLPTDACIDVFGVLIHICLSSHLFVFVEVRVYSMLTPAVKSSRSRWLTEQKGGEVVGRADVSA